MRQEFYNNYRHCDISKRTRIQIGSHEIKRQQHAWQPESSHLDQSTVRVWGEAERDRTVLRRELSLRQEFGREASSKAVTLDVRSSC